MTRNPDLSQPVAKPRTRGKRILAAVGGCLILCVLVALLLDVNCDAITNETPAEAEAYLQQAREAVQAAGLDFAAYAVTMLAADGQHYTTELAF